MNRFIWLAITCFLIVPPCFVILFSYIVRQQLEHYVGSLEARGEVTDPVVIVGPKIDPATNFFEAPIIRHLRGESPDQPETAGWEDEPTLEWNSLTFLSPADRSKVRLPEYFAEFTQSHHFGGAPADEMLLIIEKESQKYAHTVDAIFTATLRPHAWKSYRYEMGFDVSQSETAPLATFQKLIQMKTAVAIEAGESATALEWLLCDLRLSRHLSSHPPLLFQIIAISNLKTTITNIQLGLRHQVWTNEQLESIRTELRC